MCPAEIRATQARWRQNIYSYLFLRMTTFVQDQHRLSNLLDPVLARIFGSLTSLLRVDERLISEAEKSYLNNRCMHRHY